MARKDQTKGQTIESLEQFCVLLGPVLNQTTTSANLRYVKFCGCNSHSQNKLCVVFCLSFSLKRLRFLVPAWLRENTAIFTANAGKSRQLYAR